MKIILVISDKTGKNILFILDNLQALSLKEAINMMVRGDISGVHVVGKGGGKYLRSNPNTTKADNLDSIAIPLASLTQIGMLEKSSVFNKYCKRKEQVLKELEKKGEKLIYINGKPKETEKMVVEYLSEYKEIIRSAANDLKVDKYLLGAILIDEYLRLDRVDEWRDKLAKLGFDTSVGIAQVKISTARDLIQRGFYPADPSDKSIAPQKINQVSMGYLYDYVNDPRHSVYFAAAKINQIKKDFALTYDMRKLDIIADLYSRGSLKKGEVKASPRGKQIATEFIRIAKRVLK